MKQVTIDLPDHFDIDEKEVKRFLAAKLYESGRLSLGQAAEMAELSKAAFAEILSDFNVSLINYDPSEILKDADRL